MQFANLDSASTIFLKRDLEHRIARALEVKYAKLKFRQFFPINREADPADTNITVEVYDQVGMAKIISAYADDLPRSDVSLTELNFPIRSIGTSFGHSILEVAAAAKTGKSLSQRKVNACRRSIEQTLNSIAFNGDAVSGLLGFFTNPNVPVGNVVDPGGGTEWVNKTPDQILFDINDMFSDQEELTNEQESARVLVLPIAQYNYIAATKLGTASDTTILEFLISKSPWLEGKDSVMKLSELKGIGAGGTDVMYAYDPDPEKLEMHIPQEVEFMNPQEVNLEIKVPAHARCGGMHIYYPLSVFRREGI